MLFFLLAKAATTNAAQANLSYIYWICNVIKGAPQQIAGSSF